MSNEIIVKLEEGLYEEYLEDLQKKYYGGINKVNFKTTIGMTKVVTRANRWIDQQCCM